MAGCSHPGGGFQIIVRGRRLQVYAVAANASVLDLKRTIEMRTQISASSQRLIFAGRQLSSSASLSSYGVRAESTLDLSLRLRGGSDDDEEENDEEEEEGEEEGNESDDETLEQEESKERLGRVAAGKRKRTDYSSMKYRELQIECKKRKLKATGTKKVLLARLQPATAGTAAADAPPPIAPVVAPRRRASSASASQRVPPAAAVAVTRPDPARNQPKPKPQSPQRVARRRAPALVAAPAPALAPAPAAALDPAPAPAPGPAAAVAAGDSTDSTDLNSSAESLFSQIVDPAILSEATEMFYDTSGELRQNAAIYMQEINIDRIKAAALLRRYAFEGRKQGIDISTGKGVIREIMNAQEQHETFMGAFAALEDRFNPLDPTVAELQDYLASNTSGGAQTGIRRRLRLYFPPGHTKGVGRRSGTYPDNIVERWCRADGPCGCFGGRGGGCCTRYFSWSDSKYTHYNKPCCKNSTFFWSFFPGMKKLVTHDIEFDDKSSKKVDNVKLAVRSILNATKNETLEPFQVDFWLMDQTGAVLHLDKALLEMEKFCPPSHAQGGDGKSKPMDPEPLHVRFTWRAKAELGVDSDRNILGPQNYIDRNVDGNQHRWNAYPENTWLSPFDNELSNNYVTGFPASGEDGGNLGRVLVLLAYFLTVGALNNSHCNGWPALAALICGAIAFAAVYAVAGLTRGATRYEVEKFDVSMFAAIRRKLSALLWRNDIPPLLPPLAALTAAALVVYLSGGKYAIMHWFLRISIDAVEKVRHVFCPPLLESFVAALHNSANAIASTVALLLLPVIAAVFYALTRRQQTIYYACCAICAVALVYFDPLAGTGISTRRTVLETMPSVTAAPITLGGISTPVIESSAPLIQELVHSGRVERVHMTTTDDSSSSSSYMPKIDFLGMHDHDEDKDVDAAELTAALAEEQCDRASATYHTCYLRLWLKQNPEMDQADDATLAKAIVAKFDINDNGAIEGEELEAANAHFADIARREHALTEDGAAQVSGGAAAKKVEEARAPKATEDADTAEAATTDSMGSVDSVATSAPAALSGLIRRLLRVLLRGFVRASIIPLLFLPFASALLLVLNVSDSNSWMAKRRLHHRVWYAPEKTSCWPEASAHLEKLNTRLTSIKLGYLACLLPYFKRSVAFCQQLLITGDIKHAILDQKDDDTDGAGGASEGGGGGKWKSISLVINTNYTDTRRPTQKKQKGSEWRRLKLRYNIDELTPDLKNFRRLIRTTCGFGLHSETKDPDFQIVDTLTRHYALSSSLLQTLREDRVYMCVAAGPTNKPRNNLAPFSSGYFQGLILGSGEWRSLVNTTLAIHAFCLAAELFGISHSRDALTTELAKLLRLQGWVPDLVGGNDLVSIASWSPTWWATHVASLIFLGTITRASVASLIGVGSLWPSRFRGIGLFESMIRATTYPLTHHTFELAVFLAFLAVKRTGAPLYQPTESTGTLLVNDLNWWFTAWGGWWGWIVLIQPLWNELQGGIAWVGGIAQNINIGFQWAFVNRGPIMVQAAIVVGTALIVLLAAFAYSNDQLPVLE